MLVHHPDPQAGGGVRTRNVDFLAAHVDLARGWFKQPDRMLISVDLPAPFSPRSARISPLRSVRVDIVVGFKTVKVFHDMAHLNDVVGLFFHMIKAFLYKNTP